MAAAAESRLRDTAPAESVPVMMKVMKFRFLAVKNSTRTSWRASVPLHAPGGVRDYFAGDAAGEAAGANEHTDKPPYITGPARLGSSQGQKSRHSLSVAAVPGDGTAPSARPGSWEVATLSHRLPSSSSTRLLGGKRHGGLPVWPEPRPREEVRRLVITPAILAMIDDRASPSRQGHHLVDVLTL
jgi:hypothetical protein